jgi:hypothetical protein
MSTRRAGPEDVDTVRAIARAFAPPGAFAPSRAERVGASIGQLLQLSPWQSRVASVSFRCLRPSPADYRELAAELAETADRIEGRRAAQIAADRRMARPDTPDRISSDGVTTITVKRACNVCGRRLGDATDAELDAAMFGAPLPDVRDECGCLPVGSDS